MQELILIGGGGHCKSCIDVIEQTKKYNIVGILDTHDKIGQDVLGYKIIGADVDIEKYANQNCHFLITLGQIESPNLRIKIFEKVKKCGAVLETIISPLAYVSKHAKIGEGTIIMHNALINAGVEIGKNCTINSKALIEHDCKIEDNCHISICATLAGSVVVNKNSFIGANATVVQGVEIIENSFIKAGSLVK